MADSVHPLRAYRLAQAPKVTLAVLAGKIGTTKATLSRLESGEPCSIDLARRIAKVTGLQLRDVLPCLAAEFDAATEHEPVQ